MHPYTNSLQKYIQPHADSHRAAPMKAYMRNQFDYLGIKSPELAELQKSFLKIHGLPNLKDLEQILRDLWVLPEREYQYTAIGLLGRMENQILANFTHVMEYLIITKSWWDTVDSIAGNIVGEHFKRFPHEKDKFLARWRKSENLWLRRTTLLFQLGYKEETDFPLLCNLISENLGSREFFINKAIGWSLRQYSKVNPKGVRKFVAETPLQPLSRREALKWLENNRHKPDPDSSPIHQK